GISPSHALLRECRCAELPHPFRNPESRNSPGGARPRRIERNPRSSGSAPGNGAARCTCPPTRRPATRNSYSRHLTLLPGEARTEEWHRAALGQTNHCEGAPSPTSQKQAFSSLTIKHTRSADGACAWA